ncbi:MAG TPA: hypothetical protein VG013_31430 [Gemmataceae bacterium]|jgi:hypothetical protein|nr:hypothetical protein [Gemmataceae bacterium]
MRHYVALTAFGMLALAGSPLLAEEPPYREFVQGLRDKHYADLAEEYLEQLSHHKLPPNVAAILPLELARTRVAHAEDKADPNQRLTLYNKAREDFTAFLKTNPAPELAAEVNFDLARLIRLQGKVQLLLAQQQDAPEAQRALKLKARAQFEEAAGGLAQAAKQLGDQLAKHDSAATPEEKAQKRTLARAKLQADLESGLDVFDQLQTYDEQFDEPAKRTDVAQKAIDILKKVAAEDDSNPICWNAKAWLMRCHQEIDSPDEPTKIYAQIVDKGAAPPEVQRLAKYFRMLGMKKDIEDPKKNRVLATLGEKWLVEYRADHHTPEGDGVRYLLAETYLHRALLMPKAQQNGLGAQDLYAKAEKLYGALEQTENEFTQQAHLGKLRIILVRSEERSKGDISKLKNFQECYIRARLEIAQMNEDEKEKGAAKQRKQKRRAHFNNMIAALSRALDLVDDMTPEADRIEARYILAYAYLSTDQPYPAAVTGEFLAHSEPKSSRAATAAAYALEAYSRIIGEEERGDKRDSEHDQDVEADRDRLKKLAQYMEQIWPEDPATDMARHQLGTIAIREKNYPEAIAALSRIKATYGSYSIAQFQLAVAAQEAAKDNLPPAKGRPPYSEQALAALQKIPELPANADPVVAQFYVYGKLKLAQILFEKKRYKEMAQVSDHIRQVFAKAPLADNVRQDLQAAVDGQPFYAEYGQAEVAFRAGNYADALKLVEPFVKQLKEDKLGWFKDTSLIRNILGLALRADVQQGNKDQAKEILDLLQKKGAGSLEGGATAILVDLVQQLKTQVEDLRKRGKPAEEELQKTVKSFSEFLDELAKQPPKTLTPEIVRFLAFSYASLDEHAKAAALLKEIPKPEKSHAADKDKAAKEDQEKVAVYHSVRLLYCRELRLSKQFAAADMVLKEVMATGIGKRSLDARKERILLMEDKRQYFQAATEWNKLMKDLRPRLSDNRLKEQYFEAYYHLTYSYYKHASGLKDEHKKAAGIKKAAGFITALESKLPNMGGGGLKKQYDELLAKERPLNVEYKALKKSSQ